MNIRTVVSIVFAVAALSVFAVAEISNLEVTPGSGGKVTVSYSLSEDAVVTPRFYAGGRWLAGNEVVLLTGDICCKVSATTGEARRRFVWNAKREADIDLDKTTAHSDAKVELTVWSLNTPPDYMVVDLQSENRDIVRYYATSNDVPGGVLDAEYKLRKLVLRKIPARAAIYVMGSTRRANEIPHTVAFSEDFYLGIYPVTQSQSQLAFGRSVRNVDRFGQGDDAPYRPTCGYGWNNYRGSTATPTDAPAPGSWFDSLRSATGVDFDVPTEAQWEFACRARSETAYYCGDAAMAKQNCWYTDNTTSEIDELQYTQPVGQFPPNAFGLYDMIGNVCEMCLDYAGDYPSSGVTLDQLNVVVGSKIAYRGGAYNCIIDQCRSAYRHAEPLDTSSYVAGLRLSCPAVAK